MSVIDFQQSKETILCGRKILMRVAVYSDGSVSTWVKSEPLTELERAVLQNYREPDAPDIASAFARLINELEG